MSLYEIYRSNLTFIMGGDCFLSFLQHKDQLFRLNSENQLLLEKLKNQEELYKQVKFNVLLKDIKCSFIHVY